MATVEVKLSFEGDTFLYVLKSEKNLQDLLDDASEKFQKPKDSLALFQQDGETSIETDEKLNLLRSSSPLNLSLKDKRFSGSEPELVIGRDAREEIQRAVDSIQENKKKLFELLDYNLHKTSLVFKVLNKLLDDHFVLSHFATELRDKTLPEGLRSTLFASENPSEEELIQIIRNHPFRWLNALIVGPDEDELNEYELMIKEVIAFPEKRSVLERVRVETQDFCEATQRDIFRIVLRHLSSLPSSSSPAVLTIWCVQKPKPEGVREHPGPFFMININQDLNCSLSEIQDARIAEQGRNILFPAQLTRVIPSDPEVQRKFFPFFYHFQAGRREVHLIDFFVGLDPEIQTFLSPPPRNLEITNENVRFWTGILSVIENGDDFRKVQPFFNLKGPTSPIMQKTDAWILIGLCQSGRYNDTTTKDALFTERDINNYKREKGL